MREWLRVNKEVRLKRGMVREDGKVFSGYGIGYTNGEHWCDPIVLKNKRQQSTAEYYRNRYALRKDVREKSKLRNKAWAQKHPDRINERAAKRRALKKALLHPEHDANLERQMHKLARELTEKTGVKHHVDHIIPIKHGGMHHHLNLQVLPFDVNLSKNSTPFWTSQTYKDFRSVPKYLWPEALVDFYLAIQTV